MEFFIPLKKIPTTTHQTKKVTFKSGKPRFYEPEKLREARSLFMAHLGRFVPEEKIKGAVELKVMWLFPKRKNDLNGDFKTTKPDCDNLNKLLKDCMTDLSYWEDDAQVSVEHIEKRYNDISGISISIRRLSNGKS